MESARPKKDNIVLLTEEAQQTILERANQSKSPNQRIPIVPRNFNSGWPLVQMSLYSPAANGNGYVPALGGGKCHDFKIGAFSLASLLLKIHKDNVVKGNDDRTGAKEFSLTNVNNFLVKFYLESKATGIIIESRNGAYGKMLEIKLPWESAASNALRDTLMRLEHEIFKKDSGIDIIGKFEDPSPYTKERLSTNIESDIAVFSHGQVFVDLGMLLDKYIKDSQTKEYFESIFKTKEFLQLKTQEPNLKPTAEPAREVTAPITPPKDLPKLNQSEDFNIAREKLEKMVGLNNLDKETKDIKERAFLFIFSMVSQIGTYTIKNGDEKSILARFEKLVQDPSFVKLLSSDKEMAKLFLTGMAKVKAEVANQASNPKLANNPNILLSKPAHKPATVEQEVNPPKPGKKM